MSDASINSNLEEAFKNSDWSTICAALMPRFNDYLARRSKNVFECEQVNSLEHVFTVPALYDDQAGTRKQVIVPMKVFTRDIDAELEKAKKATTAANTAAATANTAASNADKAREGLETKKLQVDDAIGASKTATEAAKKATSDTLASKTAIEKNESGRQTAEQTRQAQEAARQKSEALRSSNETSRQNQEASRVSQEKNRQSAETTRGVNETTRQTQESARQKQETARAEAENKRLAAESGRVLAENSRVSAENKRQSDTNTAIINSMLQTELAKEMNDHPQKQGDNGNWWKWNTTTKQYEDTGIIARGGMMYPTFEILDNELYVTDAGSNIEERIELEDNELVLKL
ncbi:hypothetical protein [Prevotella sp.]|nr:hypothetical protein [Prevotella sp.]